MINPCREPCSESSVVITTPPWSVAGASNTDRVPATELSSARATIWTKKRLDCFPVYLGFDGLAPYVIEGRVVAEIPNENEGSGVGQVVEFTTLLHRDELVFD